MEQTVASNASKWSAANPFVASKAISSLHDRVPDSRKLLQPIIRFGNELQELLLPNIPRYSVIGESPLRDYSVFRVVELDP